MSLSATPLRRSTASHRYTSRLSGPRELEADGDPSPANEERQNSSTDCSKKVINDTECVERLELPILNNCFCYIVTAVKIRWTTSGYAALKTIDCLCCDGVLVIRGSVASYYYKQMAQESARGVDGIHRIVNELTVAEWNETRNNARFDVEPNE